MSETPVPRPPGWTLVATTDGSRGWHRVATVGAGSVLTTVCGMSGRPIAESERAIICCPECQAVEAL